MNTAARGPTITNKSCISEDKIKYRNQTQLTSSNKMLPSGTHFATWRDVQIY